MRTDGAIKIAIVAGARANLPCAKGRNAATIVCAPSGQEESYMTTARDETRMPATQHNSTAQRGVQHTRAGLLFLSDVFFAIAAAKHVKQSSWQG